MRQLTRTETGSWCGWKSFFYIFSALVFFLVEPPAVFFLLISFVNPQTHTRLTELILSLCDCNVQAAVIHSQNCWDELE